MAAPASVELPVKVWLRVYIHGERAIQLYGCPEWSEVLVSAAALNGCLQATTPPHPARYFGPQLTVGRMSTSVVPLSEVIEDNAAPLRSILPALTTFAQKVATEPPYLHSGKLSGVDSSQWKFLHSKGEMASMDID